MSCTSAVELRAFIEQFCILYVLLLLYDADTRPSVLSYLFWPTNHPAI